MESSEGGQDQPPADPSGSENLYREPTVLERWYDETGASLSTIAEKLGCSKSTVGYWMEKHGITRRDASAHKRTQPAHFRTHQGYERWYTTVDGTTESVLVHRLLAVSEYGFEATVGNHVHHQNGIGWDNRPDNITVLAPEEHLHREAARRTRDDGRFAPESSPEPPAPRSDRQYARGIWDEDRYEYPWRDPAYLYWLYQDRELSTLDIADRLDCSVKTVRRWLRRHEIPRRSLDEAQLVRVRREPVPFGTRPPHRDDAGYEFWYHTYRRRDPEGEQSWIPVHRLLAVSEFGFEAVADCQVHHINGIRWDNRPENITLLSPERHALLTRVQEGRSDRDVTATAGDNQNR